MRPSTVIGVRAEASLKGSDVTPPAAIAPGECSRIHAWVAHLELENVCSPDCAWHAVTSQARLVKLDFSPNYRRKFVLFLCGWRAIVQNSLTAPSPASYANIDHLRRNECTEGSNVCSPCRQRSSLTRREVEAEAAKPWMQRYAAPILIIGLMISVGGLTWYAAKHQQQIRVARPENKPPVPVWAAEQRSKFPQSVWDKRVAWAAQHHCYLGPMSRDEIVRALGQPAEDSPFNPKYKRQTKECTRYQGNTCAEYRTEEHYIWLQDGCCEEISDKRRVTIRVTSSFARTCIPYA